MLHKDHMTTGAWLLFMLLMAVPMLNMVLVIIILLDKSYNPSLRNFVKAQVVVMLIGIVLLFGLWSVIMAFLRQIVEDTPQNTITIIQYLK